jgi:hypothetical protein
VRRLRALARPLELIAAREPRRFHGPDAVRSTEHQPIPSGDSLNPSEAPAENRALGFERPEGSPHGILYRPWDSSPTQESPE